MTHPWLSRDSCRSTRQAPLGLLAWFSDHTLDRTRQSATETDRQTDWRTVTTAQCVTSVRPGAEVFCEPMCLRTASLDSPRLGLHVTENLRTQSECGFKIYLHMLRSNISTDYIFIYNWRLVCVSLSVCVCPESAVKPLDPARSNVA